MQVAVIGWGSLIWCPGSLRIKTRWRPDGPNLRIEFARISRDGRLTLVIHPDSPEVQTYWAISAFEMVEEARENLREREGTKLRWIDEARIDVSPKTDSQTAVVSWLKKHTDIEAAVWTGLSSNWVDVRDRAFDPDDAVRYLSELERERDDAAARYSRACEYIRNAPGQIQTSARKKLEAKEDFKAVALSAILFEPM